jgi:hypothetical protein
MHIYRYPLKLTSIEKLPFFYVIQHKRTGKLYAGCKTANPDPSTFMCKKGYCTSSKIVRQLIDDESPDIFIIRRIRLFLNVDDAHLHEIKFLSRVDAKNNPRFLNLTNGYGGHVMMGNKPKSDQHKNNISLAHKGIKKPWITDKINHNPEKIRKTAEKHRGMKRSIGSRIKMSIAKIGYIPKNRGKKYFRSADGTQGDYFIPGSQPPLWIQGTGKRNENNSK